LAAELLKVGSYQKICASFLSSFFCDDEHSQRANELVGMKIHPTSIISGFRLAQKEAVKYINERLSVKVHCG
jgi:hypothetical protein